MNSLRGSTFSPMRMVKVSSAVMAVGRWFAGATDSGYVVGAATARTWVAVSGQLLAALTKLELLDLAESAPGSRFRKK